MGFQIFPLAKWRVNVYKIKRKLEKDLNWSIQNSPFIRRMIFSQANELYIVEGKN